MKINKIIKERRQELNLTQERVGEYLGVSTPAVNKWEKGVSYPEITMLPALARLLKTDLNTLLSFDQDLTDYEIGNFANELTSVVGDKGFEVAYKMAMEKIQKHSNCDRLIYTIASILEGSLLIYDVEDSKNYHEQIESLYERIINSEDMEVRNQIISKMISKYINRKEYVQAQELIDSLPERTIDKGQLQAKLLINEGKNYEALELLEKTLLAKVNEIQVLLLKLIEVNIEENRIEEAVYIASTFKNTASLYDLWEFHSYAGDLELALFKKDEDKSIKILKSMFISLKSKWNINKSLLYRNIKVKEDGEQIEGQLLPYLIKELEKDEKFEFLRANERFLELIRRYKENDTLKFN